MRSSIVAGLLIALIATPAVAREWSYVTTNRHGVIVALADASLTRSGKTVGGVLRFRDRKAEWHSFVSIDCSTGAIAQVSVGGANGRVLPEDLAYRPVTRGSVGDFMVARWCPDRVDPNISLRAGPVTTMPPVRPFGGGPQN